MDTLRLDNAEHAEAWLRSLAAQARTKGLTDTADARPITDLFLAKAGVDAIRRASIMAAPAVLEDMAFADIKALIVAQLQPHKRLVVAERTQFMAMLQSEGETVQEYVHRLRHGAKHCAFDKLGAAGAHQSVEDELIQVRLIAGMWNAGHRLKMLEQMQSTSADVSLALSVQFAQQLELIRDFNGGTIAKEENLVAHVDKNKGRTRAAVGECSYCGRKHARGSCPAYGKQCKKCGKINHFAAMCRSSSANKVSHVECQNGHVEFEDRSLFSLGHSSIKEVKLDGFVMPMQLDSGSEATVIPRNMWQDMGKPPLKKSTHRLKQFDGSHLRTLGQFVAVVEMSGKLAPSTVVVVACDKRHGLLGTNVLKIDYNSMSVNKVDAGYDEFPCLKGFQAKIVLRDNVQPSYFEARPVSIHLKPVVVDKLNEMVKQGILERVPPGGSRWASPLVVVRKANGDLRLCADYKVGVNPKICCDSYPIPQIESAFSDLAGMTHFAKIDLTSAYNQLELDEASREILTMNTPIGLVRWKRLPFGVKTASAQFQAAIEKTIGKSVPNMVIYQDDICIGGVSANDLSKKVQCVLKLLNDAGMTINEKKSVFKSTELKFLGYQISASGVKPDETLVKKILLVQVPSSKREVNHFMGLVNYFGRYIADFASISAPLNELRQKAKSFEWGEPHQAAFERLKKLLSEYPVVQVFDARKDTVLTTDASEMSISAVLSQDDHPVMYLSRKLTEAERRYSNIEREALAIVWATVRARHFLLGKKFMLRSDHKPLEYIFHPSRELPKVTSARLARWAIQLMAF